MCRLRFRPTVFVGVLVALTVLTLPWGTLPAAAPFAPVPKHLFPKQPLYFPTFVGARWEYSAGLGTQVVAAVEHKGGTALVTVGSEQNGRIFDKYTVAVSEAGIQYIAVHGEELEHKNWWLKQPHRNRNQWAIRTLDPGADYGTEAVSVAFGPEQVEVPAGSFNAIRVESTCEALNPPQKVTKWFAPDVGMVKMIDGGGGKKVLKGFKPGK